MKQNKSTLIKSAFFSITIVVFTIGIYTSLNFFSSNTISLNPFEIAGKLSSWYFIVLIPIITVINLFFRFLRWTFLLRSFGCIFRIKNLYLAYLTAFIGNLFPLYIPYLLRLAPLPKRFYTGLFVLIIDIAIDFTALFILCYISTYQSLLLITGLFLLFLFLITRFPSKGNGRPLPFSNLFCSILFALFFSVLIWFFTSSVLKVTLNDFAIHIPYLSSANIFASSQIQGCLSFIPAGIMSTGKALISSLSMIGIPYDTATYSVVLVRFLTFWFTIFISFGASVYYYRYNTKQELTTNTDHFDSIAEEYTEEIPEHIRLSLLEKKIGVSRSFLVDNSKKIGLDIGCGQGWYMQEMRLHGYRMIGIDYSIAQLTNASNYCDGSNHGSVCQGSITNIPIQTTSLDFAYSINTFHHLTSVHDQQCAIDELYRILKPGGICLIHEMNIKNPIFRLYMSYLFPLIKSIDTGTEIWIKGNEKMLFRNFTHKATIYQTFLPDFLPKLLYRILKPVELLFERIPLIRSFSAHLCIVLQKESIIDENVN